MSPLSRVLRPIAATLDELLFPATCAGCGRRGTWLCSDCASRLRPVPGPVCRCGLPAFRGSRVCPICADWPERLGSVRAAFVFEGPLRDSIHRLKYRGERARGRFLGELLADAAVVYRPSDSLPDLIVPMPLHARRERERGFNQAELLSLPVGLRLGAPVERALSRSMETRSQVGLGVEERRRNVSAAFSCAVGRVDDLKILLVDDVVTTGATFEAAARTLLAAGASRVDGLALAREL